MSLKQQSVIGALWTFVDIIFNKGIYFAATIILARIMGPTEFGLLGMILLFVAIGNSLIDSGMSTSLLRMNQLTESDYSTVFITNLGMSVAVYLVLYFASPFVAVFYDQPILTDVIRVYCLGFIVNAFRSIHNVKLIKDMDFRKITILNVPGNIISFIVALIMGLQGYGIWSVVALFIVNQLIATICFWVFYKWKPSWNFDYALYKSHFKFGYKLVIAAQLNTLFDNIYNVLIGKFYNIKSLAFYERAYTFNNYPVSVLSGIVLKVSLPTLATYKNDPNKIKEVYKRIMQVSFLITALILGFLSVVAEPLFYIILGEEWANAVPFFQILCLSYVFYPVHSLNINVLSVFGRSDLFLKLEVIKKILTIVVVVLCFNFGIIGLLWSSVVVSIISLLINTYYSGKFLNYFTFSQIMDLVPTLITVGIVSIATYILQSSFIIIAQLKILLSFGVGMIIFILLSEVIKLTPYIHLKEIIFTQLKFKNDTSN